MYKSTQLKKVNECKKVLELKTYANVKKYSETSLQRTPSGPENSVRYREVSATWRFFLNWLILLQKFALGCCGIVPLNPKSVKRLGKERKGWEKNDPKVNILEDIMFI